MVRGVNQILWENLREKDHLEDVDIRVTLILMWISSNGMGCMDRMDLNQHKNGWQGVVNVVMNLLVPNSAGYFVTK